MKRKTTSHLNFFLQRKWELLAILLVIVGMYLRFFRIEEVYSFGWDQARDSWTVKDMLDGKLMLTGPRTGIGHMHLGPLYFYFLLPFYTITNLDPMASNYANIFASIINYILLYFVAVKVFHKKAAVFVLFVYSFSNYLIVINRVPWNVTLMPGIAALIFYSLLQIYAGKLRWVFVLWSLSGFYFHLHFTAIFLPVINILSLLFVREKKKVVLYSLLSIPLYLIWFIPNIIHELQTNSDVHRYDHFLQYYYIGFHGRFLLHRLSDGLIQFETILTHQLPLFKFIKYVIPSLLILVALFFEKDMKQKRLAYLLGIWFIVPLIGFTLYGGPLSEYYFLYQVPMVLFILVYLQKKLLQLKYAKILLIFLICWWGFYAYINTKNEWIKPTTGGLQKQKQETKALMERGERKEFNEGDIGSYLYAIWTEEK